MEIISGLSNRNVSKHFKFVIFGLLIIHGVATSAFGKEPKDYYAILGVSKNASVEEIKRAARKKIKLYHPDSNKGDRNTEANFKDAHEALRILSDPSKRAAYDVGSYVSQSKKPEDLEREFYLKGITDLKNAKAPFLLLGIKPDPNKDNPMLTLADLANRKLVRPRGEFIDGFYQSDLIRKVELANSVVEKSKIILNEIEATITKQMKLEPVVINIFNVSRHWNTFLIQSVFANNTRRYLPYGVELTGNISMDQIDKIYYAELFDQTPVEKKIEMIYVTYRALGDWLLRLRPYSENLFQMESKVFLNKLNRDFIDAEKDFQKNRSVSYDGYQESIYIRFHALRMAHEYLEGSLNTPQQFRRVLPHARMLESMSCKSLF